MSKPRLPWFMLDKDTLTDQRLLMAARLLCKRYSVSDVDDNGDRGDEIDMSRQLSCMTAACRGALVMLWGYAHDNIRPDNTLALDPVAVDALVGIDGFCDCMPPEWLEVMDDGSGIYLPRFIEKNQIVKRLEARAKDTARHRSWRAKEKEKRVTHDKGHDNSMIDAGLSRDLSGDIETKSKEREAIASPKKATRLPANWRPDSDLMAWTATQGLSQTEIAEQLERFTDWWAAAPAAKGTKLDWPATWRNWVREALARRGRTATTPARPTRLTQESALAALGADDDDTPPCSTQETIRYGEM
jgi:hypothetical protein